MIRREYPDIEFVETDTETIENSMIALFELMYKEMTGKTKKVYPASPERLFIAWAASIVIQQRIIINETAKKNVPRYANGKYLDSLGELFKDTFRLPEARATALFRFYISEPQEQSVIVPQGTRINFDGEIVFSTTEELEIRAGDAYGDILGECLTPGIVGNNIAAGQIKEIMDTYDFFWKVENITRTAGGADKESDQSYYERLRESMESFSTAGPEGGYSYHVKSVSTAITDVSATTPEPGVVDIRVLINGGEMPTEATMQEIQDALNTSKVRPLTDKVIVKKPEEVPFHIDVTVYLPSYSQTSSAIIEGDARKAVAAYVKWQTGKMGRDINPSYLHRLLMDGSEVMLYYGTLGDYPQWVSAYSEQGLDTRRYPVDITIGEGATVIIDYSPEAFMTSEDVKGLCTTTILPMFLTEAQGLIDAHNTDENAHQAIQNAAADINRRLALIELMYNTEVKGNPFVISFDDLSKLVVTGVWNKEQRRLEF